MKKTIINTPKDLAEEAIIESAITAYDSVVADAEFDDISVEEAEISEAIEAYDELIDATDFT